MFNQYWTNANLVSITHLGGHFSEMWIEIEDFSLVEMHLKSSSAKWWPFYPGEDDLNTNSLGEIGIFFISAKFHCAAEHNYGMMC